MKLKENVLSIRLVAGKVLIALGFLFSVTSFTFAQNATELDF